MKLTGYESHGRRLLVEFRCYRCKEIAIRVLEECMKEAAEYYRDLYDLKPPLGWEDGGFYYPLFCPDCKKAYKDFMDNKDVKGGE